MGDYYLNNSTGELYGPKDGDDWGNPIIVLVGDNGKNGHDGSDGATRDVKWRLDKSNNSIFGSNSIYRVEEFGKKQMKWYSYRMAELNNAHIYVVERQ